MSDRKLIFKMVLIGDGAVGKTSMRKRYLGEKFKGNYTMTIGADFALKRINLDGTENVMQIWDLSGQMGFSKVRKRYYMGAMGALLVFDISRPATFYNIAKWLTELIDNRGEKIPIILVGNKSDLRGNNDNMVSKRVAEAYAKQLTEWSGFNVPYIETSALEGVNIDLAFHTLIDNVNEMIIKDQESTVN